MKEKEQVVKKGKLVRLDYETYEGKKLIDSSKMHKTIDIVFGHTKTSKTLDSKIKGQKIGFEFEISQKIDSEPVTLEFNYTDFDDETIETMKEEKETELEMNGSRFLCEIVHINEDENRVIIKYKDYFSGKKIKHKLRIKEIRDLKVKEQNEIGIKEKKK